MILKCIYEKDSLSINTDPTSSHEFELSFINRIGIDGKSAYEQWIEQGHTGTKTEFIAWLQQPAIDAAQVATTAVENADRAARAAGQAAALADTSRENLTEAVDQKLTQVDQTMAAVDRAVGAAVSATVEASGLATSAAEQAASDADAARLAASGANTAASGADSAAEYATEVAAGMDGRMTKAETNLFQLRTVELPLKADLDPVAKTVLPTHIAPLQGLQTGVHCSNGYFGGTAAQYPNLCFAKERTIEVSFVTASDVTTGQDVYNEAANSTRPRIFMRNSILNVYGVGSIGSNPLSVSIKASTSYHVLISVNSSESVVYMNGIKIGVVPSNLDYFNSIGNIYLGKSGGLNNPFLGVINKIRLFNYALSDAQCQLLWNNGDSLNYMISNELRSKCVAEFLPCGLLADKWRDTSGNGNDIAAVGTPQLTYERPAYAKAIKTKSITIDTPVLWNDTQCIITNDTITKTNHGLVEDNIVEFNVLNGGVDPIPANIRATDDVWYVHKIDENNFQLYNKNKKPDTLVTGLIQGSDWNFRRNSLDTIFTGIPTYKIKTINIAGRLIYRGSGGSPFISNIFNVPVFINKSINDIVAQTTSYRAYSSGATGRVVDSNNKYIYNSTTFNIYHSQNLLVITSISYNSAKSDNIINAGSFSRSEAATSMYLSGDVTNIYPSDYGKCCVGSINEIGNGVQITIEYYE